MQTIRDNSNLNNSFERLALDEFAALYECETENGRRIVDTIIANIVQNVKSRPNGHAISFGELHAKILYLAFFKWVNLSEGTRAQIKKQFEYLLEAK